MKDLYDSNDCNDNDDNDDNDDDDDDRPGLAVPSLVRENLGNVIVTVFDVVIVLSVISNDSKGSSSSS